MMKTKDAVVHIPHHRPLGLLFHIAQFEMQLQGTMSIQCEHITKQHGGTVFTEEITHYAAASHKKIIQLYFHCICWREFVWKWISTVVGNRALTDGKKEERKKNAQMEVRRLYFDADL